MDRDEASRELAERLNRLEDMDEIRQLYIDYGRHLDAGEPVAYAALFARDAKVRPGPVMRANGRVEIERAAAAMLQPAPDGSKDSVHLLGSPRVEITGDAASGECVWVAISKSEADSPVVEFIRSPVARAAREITVRGAPAGSLCKRRKAPRSITISAGEPSLCAQIHF